ncbi:hypothetical protein [Microvirga arabica]|nr:hypothetical protein [Microvirga arabica]
MSGMIDAMVQLAAWGKLLLPLIAVGLILTGRLTIRRIRKRVGGL